MKRYWLALAGLVVLVAGMAWLLSGTPAGQLPTTPTSSVTTSQSPAGVAVAAKPQQAIRPDAPAPVPVSQDAGLDKAAILSMREARINGDPRAPPMSPPSDERTPPTAAELADPARYAGYEKSQTLKAYQKFVDAVPHKVASLQQALDEAAQPGSGITPEQQAFARQKIADLKALQEKLLQENPGLKAPVTQGQSSSGKTAVAP